MSLIDAKIHEKKVISLICSSCGDEVGRCDLCSRKFSNNDEVSCKDEWEHFCDMCRDKPEVKN